MSDPVISDDEKKRRRKIVSSADWSSRMEGLGKPSPERVTLDECWIAGQITREEYEREAMEIVRRRLAAQGHTPPEN